MPKFPTARRSYGPCFSCGEPINKGDRYYRFFLHATEEERNDPKVKKTSFGYGSTLPSGPLVQHKAHEACHPRNNQ